MKVRMNQIDNENLKKMKKKNTGMHSQMMKDEWGMMKDEYEVYCMTTTITIFEWLVNASTCLSISFVSSHSLILVISAVCTNSVI